MTGKKLIQRQPLHIKERIEKGYGSTGNYYNELFQMMTDIHYIEEKGYSQKLLQLKENALKRRQNELENFGVAYANDIINAIRIDVEVYFNKREIEALQHEQTKYDEYLHSFWQNLKQFFVSK
ncbi:hypothetical protein J8281_02455 [Aquimarina sp. U1-2]|uniref:hypothetical protein n=1 Tax=Aquimarina sp. U1-2 TaxID=2823141 RepID=UPI001AECE74C|nr:hypothetical protein [Aquimarina sp. U1-2]MBP2831037.1 hypothetical protein [Aquimarina sp. U1-2]